MGIATRGLIRSSASAARRGSRWPLPRRGPQKCDVDGAGELGHLREEVGVTRKVEPRAAGDPVAECLRGRAEWASPAVVFRAKRLQLDAADVESFPGRDLHDLVVTGAAAHRAETSRHDDSRPPADAAKRRQVKVIVMRVRDEDHVDVDVLNEMGDRVGVAMKKAQAMTQQRVGENAHAIHLDQDGRVPEVPKMSTHRPSLLRA